MSRHRTRSPLSAWCCTAAGAWGRLVLVAAAACNALDEPRSGATPSRSTASPGGAAPGTASPGGLASAPSAPSDATDANRAISGNGAAVDGSGAAASPPPSALEPASGGNDAGGNDAGAAAQPTADGGEIAAPAASDPSSDENLRFILEDGFETTYFAVHCSAIGEDGTEIDGDRVSELPVGGGFVLECNLDGLPSQSTTDVLSAANEPWCALGELRSFATGGDERLAIVLASPPDSPAPTLIATREGEPINLQLASAFGARLWPVWLVTSYDVVQVARAEQGKLCDEVFEL